MEHTEEYVKLENVSKIYGSKEVKIIAVDEISFRIKNGEFVVVVGPSGAGKTTVLNILGGMDKATSGNVWIDGKNIAKYTDRQLTGYRREDIGFVFQFYNLVPNLTFFTVRIKSCNPIIARSCGLTAIITSSAAVSALIVNVPSDGQVSTII